MRLGSLLLLSSPFLFQAATSDDTSPFYQAFVDAPNPILDRRYAAGLAKRDTNNCPDDYNSCAMLGSDGACCRPDTVCSRDDANNIACCPSGAACTGVLTRSSTETGGGTQTTSGFMFPQPGTRTVTSPPTLTGSTVPGAPFPFVIIPTTFSDQAECVQSYSGCESQFSKCVTSLGGVNGVNGVTVDGGNGQGVTRAGVQATAGGREVCTSLSREACHGLQQGYCTAFAGGDGSGNAAVSRRSTAGIYELLTGLAIAVAGMIT